jgi:mono/diheme cytochrome c family protein
VPESKSEYAGEHRESPNAEFAELLERMNMQMIARQLGEQENFAVYRYAILGAAEGNCGDLVEFLPAAQRAGAQAALRRLLQTAESARALQDEVKRLRALPGTPSVELLRGPGSPSSALDAVSWLAEAALGMPTADWTLALEKGTYDFTVQRGSNAALAGSLRQRIEQGDPEVRELAPLREYSADDRYCRYLRERSRAVLAASPESQNRNFTPGVGSISPAALTPEAALQHCAVCHAAGPAPPLPFDRPLLLSRLLRRGNYPHGDLLDEILFRLAPQAGAAHMPPDANWPPPQRDSLSRYILGLARTGVSEDRRQ